MKLKYLIYILLITLTGSGCDVTPPALESPFDPNSPNFTGNPPGSINIISLSENSIKLCWKDSSNLEKGYIIQRKINDGNYIDCRRLNPNDTSFIDINLEIKNTYYYRILTIIDTNKYSSSKEICIKYNPYPDKIRKICSDVITACISPDGNYLAVKTQDYKIIIYQISDLSVVVSTNSDYASSFIFSNDGKYLYISSSHYDESQFKTIYKIDRLQVIKGAILKKIINLSEYVTVLAVNKDNSTLVYKKYSDQAFIVWDLVSGVQKAAFSNFSRSISSQFLNDDKYFGVFSDSTLSLWNTETWRMEKKLNYGSNTNGWYSYSISPDNKYLFNNGSNSFVTIWNLENQNRVGIINVTGNFLFVWDKRYFISFGPGMINVQTFNDSYELYPVTKINLGDIRIKGLFCSKKGDLLLITDYSANDVEGNLLIDHFAGCWQMQ